MDALREGCGAVAGLRSTLDTRERLVTTEELFARWGALAGRRADVCAAKAQVRARNGIVAITEVGCAAGWLAVVLNTWAVMMEHSLVMFLTTGHGLQIA